MFTEYCSFTDLTPIKQGLQSSGEESVTLEQENVQSVETTLVDQAGASTIYRSMGIKKGVSTDITKFLTRPTQLYTFSITTITDMNIYNPIVDFLYAVTMKLKWWNYHLFRGTMVVTISLVTPSYAYGRIQCSILYNNADFSAVPTNAAANPYIRSTYPHVQLDAGMASTAILRIPYTEQVPYYNLHKLMTYTKIPKVGVSLLSPITRCDTGAASTGNMTISAHFEDIELAVPVPIDYQSDLESNVSSEGFISGPASAISRITAKLSSVPILGKFAEAASIGSYAVSQIAVLFGFSKPIDLNTRTTVGFVPSAYAYGDDQFRKLTLDPKQGVSPDPKMFSMGQDPLACSEFIGKFGLISQFTMPVSSVAGQIQYYPVMPCVFSTAGTTTGEVTFSPLGFGCVPFQFWLKD